MMAWSTNVRRHLASCVRGSITGSHRGCYLTRVNRKGACRSGIRIPEESPFPGFNDGRYLISVARWIFDPAQPDQLKCCTKRGKKERGKEGERRGERVGGCWCMLWFDFTSFQASYTCFCSILIVVIFCWAPCCALRCFTSLPRAH